jgi:hypothetical protein
MNDKTKNSAAIWGLILGIISLFAWGIPYFGALISILGLVQSVIGQKSEKKEQAIIGLVLNIVGLFATIFTLFIALMYVSNNWS